MPIASLKKQLANRLAWNESRPPRLAAFFTVSYSGRTAEEMIAALREHSVWTLVDVRHNAVSLHRPEMSKGNLAKLLEAHGIAYVHAPQLGVPNDVRAEAAAAGDREVIWTWFDRHVAASPPDLRAFIESFQQPVALMCMELDPQYCHRHRLALALEKTGLRSFDI